MKHILQTSVLGGLFLAFLTGAFAWDVSISGNGRRSADTARAVTVDASGNVVAAGTIANPDTGEDFTVIKLDATGRELWRQSIYGSSSDSAGGGANAVVADARGDVIAAGFMQNSGTLSVIAPPVNDFTVAKFDGTTGAELWRQVIDGTTAVGSNDEARTVAVDFRGDVFAAGFIREPGFASVLSQFFVVKLSGLDGGELWRQTGGTGSAANSVAVDAIGDVVVGGVSRLDKRGQLVPSKFTVSKFAGGTGVELWRQDVEGSAGYGGAFAVTVDAEGSVLAAGFTFNSGTSGDFAVIKFDGTSGQELWRQAINGTANGFDVAHAVTVDASGDVFAAGRTQPVEGDDDFTVAKLKRTTGEVIWVKPVVRRGRLGDANAVIVDGAGNVTAVGVIQDLDSPSSQGGSLAVLKFDGGTGTELWGHLVSNAFALGVAVAIDGAGNPVAAGRTSNVGSDQDFFVAKFEASRGTELWRQEINGLGFPTGGFANAVALDSRGRVVAAGSISNIGTDEGFVIKLDRGHGTELWRATINGGPFDFLRSVAIDGSGDVVASGRSRASDNVSPEFLVAKLAGDSGRELWRYGLRGTSTANAVTTDHAGDVVAAGPGFSVVKLDRTTGLELWQRLIAVKFNDSALAVTVDVAGDVVAAGRHDDYFTVAKLDRTTGSLLWQKAVPGTAINPDGQANAVAVDGVGDVVAAGEVRNVSDRDFTVVKFDGRSGQTRWQQSLRGTGTFESEAKSVAIDSEGNVVAGGIFHNTETGDDFVVVKFDGNTGTELWRQVITGSDFTYDEATSSPYDEALSVGLDPEGHVIAAGVIRNTDTANDFAVFKFDRATGAELWRRVIDGTEHGDDAARALVADQSGNIVVAGWVRNIGTGPEFTVIKLRGSDGGDFTGKPRIRVSPKVVRAGETITATWSDIAEPSARDWIGIYAPGARNREFIDWVYVSCSRTPGNAQAEGSCPLSLPANFEPGEYELRLFANDSYTRLDRSGVFRVRRALSDEK